MAQLRKVQFGTGWRNARPVIPGNFEYCMRDMSSIITAIEFPFSLKCLKFSYNESQGSEK